LIFKEKKQFSFSLFMLLLLFTAAFLLHGYFQTADTPEEVYYVDTAEKKVAFTFEILWEKGYLDETLQLLEKENLEVTFFLTGEWLNKNSESVDDILNYGHDIGNHSMSHRSFILMSQGEIRQEIDSFTQLLEEEHDYMAHMFRPPFGEYNNLIVQTAAQKGYTTVLWSIESLDHVLEDAGKVKERIEKQLHPGAIINFRVNSKESYLSLPGIIKEIRERGYEIVTLPSLLEK